MSEFWGEQVRAALTDERVERVVQMYLAEVLGQVHCSDDESHHDPDMLPCQRCGAAL